MHDCTRIPGAGAATCCDSCHESDAVARQTSRLGTLTAPSLPLSRVTISRRHGPNRANRARFGPMNYVTNGVDRVKAGDRNYVTKCVNDVARSWILRLLTFAALLCTVLSLTTPPTITRQPKRYDITYDSRENVILECEAAGDPKPQYSWYKDGSPIDFSSSPRYAMPRGSGTMTITDPDKETDEGFYQCNATNAHGTALSKMLHVREAFIDQMPKVFTPETHVAGLNRHVTLTCTPPDALPAPDIFWTSGGGDEGDFEAIPLSKRVTIDHDGNLHILTVKESDANDGMAYSCNVFNPILKSIQQGYDQIIEISGEEPPTDLAPTLLWSSPINTIAMKGRKLKLKCIFAGSPTPEVTWRKNLGNDLPRTTRFGSFGQELQIKRVDFSDQGQYECIGDNGIGTPTSRVITVQVQSKPFFTVKPTDKNGAEEETHSILCAAKGNPPPDVQIYRNGIPIENLKLDNKRHSLQPGNLTIKGLLKDADTAVFQCNASNVHGYVFADGYLNVLAEPPMFTQKPDLDLRVVEGSDATLICRTFGAPKPKITWSRGAQLLSGDHYGLLENGDLVVKNVRKDDQGVYTCIASNKFGDISAQGELRVFTKTRITMAPESVTERAGLGAGFKCKAEGDKQLRVTIVWRKNGRLLKEDGRVKVKASKGVQQFAESSVVIADVSDSDSGDFACVARTDLDTVDAKAQLVVQDVPQPPGIPEILQCRAREALIAWKPGGDGRSPILNYIIQSNTSFDPDDWKNLDTDIQADTLQREVELSPWANYTFRVFARNKLGVSEESAPSKICATPPDTPDRNPAGVKGEGSQPDNMVISWEPMPKIEQNGPGFHYIVKYRRSDEEPKPAWETMRIANPMESQLMVPNQPTYVPFDVMVIAHNNLGQSKEVATVKTGHSGEAMPQSPPRDFECSRPITPTTTHCTWTPVPRGSLRGKPVGYKIQFWVEEEGEASMEEHDFPFEDIESGSVTLLKPYSNIVLQIRVRNSRYESEASNRVKVRTPEGRPGPVVKLRATPVGLDQFKVTWKTPKDPNGELHGYRLRYSEVQGFTLANELTFDSPIPPTTNSLRLTGLKEKTKYRITMAAYTSVGEGKEFFIESTTTVTSPPDEAAFEIHQVSDKTLNVSVNPAQSDNPGSNFFVEIKHFNAEDWKRVEVMDPVGSPFVELKGLEPGTAYAVRVVASNGPQAMKKSQEQYIVTTGEGPDTKFAYATWFIVLMCIIILLIIILIIVCLIKRSRGGRYPVQKKEQEAGYDPERDGEAGLGEFTRTEDDQDLLHRGSRGSLNGSLKPVESDADSLAAYGDGEGGKFNEDGSFIGQYGPDKKRSNTGWEMV